MDAYSFFILISNKRTILNKKIEEAVAIDAPNNSLYSKCGKGIIFRN